MIKQMAGQQALCSCWSGLERIRIEDIAKVSVHGLKSQAMFDYFAGGIFQNLDAALQYKQTIPNP